MRIPFDHHVHAVLSGDLLNRGSGTYAGAALFARDPGLARAVLEEILRVLEASFARDRIDVLAHPTLSPLAALGDPEAHYPAEWQERLAALCVRAAVALELNESYRVPHRAFVDRAKRAGAAFAVGSDSHARLLPLDYTLALVEATGIGDSLYE